MNSGCKFSTGKNSIVRDGFNFNMRNEDICKQLCIKLLTPIYAITVAVVRKRRVDISKSKLTPTYSKLLRLLQIVLSNFA